MILSIMSCSWGEWHFSPSIQEGIVEFTKRIHENFDSTITQQWQYLYNVNLETCESKSPVEVLNETCDVPCNIEGLITSTIEAIESGSVLDEGKFKDMSTNQLSRIFTKVEESLTDSGFTNFCKVASNWEHAKLLNVCFDSVILQKLLEKEEASLSTINAVKEIGGSKLENLTQCMIKLVTNKENNFSDAELLEQVYDVLPDHLKEDVMRAIIMKDNFNESNWQLLQVLSFKTSNSLESIIMFMNSKCEEFAHSQTFARLLVHICKNLQCNKHKEVLLNVIEKNQCLLKHQAKKYLLSA